MASSLSLITVIKPSAICGITAIEIESVTVESSVLVTVIVKSTPLVGAPDAISLAVIVILPDWPDSKFSESVSTLMVNQSLTALLLMSATNVSVDVPKLVTIRVRLESPNGDAIIRSSLESTITSCLSAT